MALINFSDFTEEKSDTVTVVIQGRISNVRWLETEYSATKGPVVAKRGPGTYQTFQAYFIELPEGERLSDLLRRLQGEQEDGAGIWFETE